MADVHVRIQFGRDYVEIDINSTKTFGDLRQQIEQRTGLVEGGARLLYKGKKYGDSVTLCSVGVGTTSKSERLAPPKVETVNMMALKTQKQHESDRENQKLQKLGRNTAGGTAGQLGGIGKGASSSSSNRGSASGDLTPVKDDSESHLANSVNASDRSLPKTIAHKDCDGDAALENTTSIFVSRGRSKYRVGVDLQSDETGRDVKERLCALGGEWTGWTVKDIRLLAKGRVVNDDQLLRESGVRHGDTMMALVSAKRHAAVDAARGMATLSREIQTLSQNAQSLHKRVHTRVLSTEDTIVRVEELKRECQRLRSNLEISESQNISTETSRSQMLKLKSDLEDVETSLDKLSM